MFKMSKRSEIRPTFRLLSGWLGLVLYLCAFSPVGMGAAALLEIFDSDHHASLQPGANCMRLVLRHDVKCSAHQHHSVARTLTFFAQPATTTEPDHVLQFASGDGVWREAQEIVWNENIEEHSHVSLAANFFSFQNKTDYSIPPPWPPPDSVNNLLSIRFTVLLI